MKNRTVAVAVVAVAVVVLAAVVLSGITVNQQSQVTQNKTVMQIAEENGNFTKLVGALNSTGLTEALNGSGPFTVFAPTDAAFDALNLSGVSLPTDKANLTKILQYHVAAGSLMASGLSNGQSIMTLEGSPVTIIQNASGTYVNDAKIVTTDLVGSNGVVHVIDAVLMPVDIVQAVTNNSEFSTLATALQKANLTDTLNSTGPFTVFAPTDAAFAAANQTLLNQLMSSNDTTNLTKLLTYHVIPSLIVLGNGTGNMTAATVEGGNLLIKANGDNFTVNNAKVVGATYATNGVIYTVDKVLMNPKTIVETAMEDGNFTKLVAALQAANLTAALNGTGPFTVFAPTDAAFNALDQATLQKLLTTDKDNLSAILQYHVVPGTVYSFDIVNNMTVATLNGLPLNITVEGNQIMVGNATVQMTDIVTTNGVIHVIDKVLMPPNMDASSQDNMTTSQ
jgi:transforming growth factor-beta-induced protein